MDMQRIFEQQKRRSFYIFFKPAWARQIFASTHSSRLALTQASPCATFMRIYQKFDSRRMDEFYEYAT
jgi:hypothetical protein